MSEHSGSEVIMGLGRLRLVAVAFVLLAVLGTSVRADEPAQAGHGDAVAQGAKDHGDVKAESPNLFDLALDLSLWTLVIFLVLVFVLGRFAWRPMLEGLHQREASIHSAIQEAHKAREEAERMRIKFQEDAAKAQQEVAAILDKGRHDAQRVADELMAGARTEIQKERERLRREIETARDQALRELWAQAAQLATSISAKAIRRQLTEDDHRRLVDEALADLQQAGEQRQRTMVGV
jgi:F-type H+-transporting ATPase subunit b